MNENKVARGVLYLILAQLSILVSGYLIHIYLARKFGPATYGVFGIILSLFAINKVVFLSGPSWAVSKYISAMKGKAQSILKSGMVLQLFLVGVCLAFYFFFSDKVALIFKDPSLTNLIWFSSLIILPVGIYVIIVRGYFNGMKMFKHQALLETLHSFLKVVLVFFLVYFGFKIFGTLTAYIVAPFLVFLIALKFVGGGKTKEKFSKKDLIKFGLPVTLFYIVVTITLEFGLLSVKAILNDNILTGFYTSANSLARIPYSLFSAFPAIMLPSISSALAEKNNFLVRKYIRQSLRYAVMVLFPVAILISVYGTQIIEIFYSSVYSPAGSVLQILIFGFAFFSLFVIMCSFMTGANKPQAATYLAVIVLAITFFLNIKLIPLWGLKGAALAAVGTAFLGTIMASLYVYIKFKTLFGFLSTVRILFASAIIFVLAKLLPVSGYMFIVYMVLFLLLYLFLLRLFRELKDKDIDLFLSVLKLKQSKQSINKR